MTDTADSPTRRRLFEDLVGKALWACRRAADMATFQFGRRNAETDRFGRPCEVGDYALHVQCAWRILRDGAIVVGSGDIHYPADHDGDQPIPQDFDWDRQPNRRDRLLARLFDDGKREFVVERVSVGSGGWCRIEFRDNLRLEILPESSMNHEHWRLFATKEGGEHLVVGGE